MSQRVVVKKWHCVQCGKSGIGERDIEAHFVEHVTIEQMLHEADLPHEPLLPVQIKLDRVWE